jgi:hypothetical protein
MMLGSMMLFLALDVLGAVNVVIGCLMHSNLLAFDCF